VILPIADSQIPIVELSQMLPRMQLAIGNAFRLSAATAAPPKDAQVINYLQILKPFFRVSKRVHKIKRRNTESPEAVFRKRSA